MVMVATCTTGGYTLHECDCGDSYQDSETEALGHNFVEGGYSDYTWNYCTRCYTYDYGTNSADEGASTYSVMTASTDGCPNNVELASTTTVEHEYIYASGKLLRETYGTTVLDFLYDQSGNPYAMIYNGTPYYYILNIQGDVVRLMSASGVSCGVYRYDAWGNITYMSDSEIANANPLRYRGYYYDSETGFYYCQSRYYDPEIGRFINADQFASTGQGFLGYNMFAYCNNNPVVRTDSSGLLSKNLNAKEKDEYDLYGPGGKGGNGYRKTTTIYRSVGVNEALDIKQSGKFRTTSTSMACKQFGLDYAETALFGEIMGNNIIVSAEIPSDALSMFYRGTVDPSIFRCGTLTIYEELLEIFNQLIAGTIQIY